MTLVKTQGAADQRASKAVATERRAGVLRAGPG
jgi:hypothetical protein